MQSRSAQSALSTYESCTTKTLRQRSQSTIAAVPCAKIALVQVKLFTYTCPLQRGTCRELVRLRLQLRLPTSPCDVTSSTPPLPTTIWSRLVYCQHPHSLLAIVPRTDARDATHLRHLTNAQHLGTICLSRHSTRSWIHSQIITATTHTERFFHTRPP